MKPSLCLNMIVRNESARIERCLQSVLPYVKTAVIMDTGSTDDTIEIIHRVCEEHSVPVVVGTCEFVNFSQARNAAFELARVNTAYCFTQFALLMDADMELRVTDPAVFDTLDARATAYDMIQTSGSMSYANRRIVNLNIPKDIYLGVTHEYIDIPGNGVLKGVDFYDHADGANRPGKFERDAKLLEEALTAEPTNGRYWYYLGNSYLDWGKFSLAITAYKTRIDLGGWDEETHSAMMKKAECHKALGEHAEFVAGMIEAYNFRPTRAEPPHALAQYYREKNQHAASLVWSKTGLHIKRPDDLLFVNNFVYSHGLRYEYAISGYYDEAERGSAFEITNALALDPTCPHTEHMQARNNLYFFTKPLSHYCSSFRATKLDFTPPAGYTAMNPSVEQYLGRMRCNIRCVNYKIDEHGRYMIGPKECNEAPIDTRNFVVHLDYDMAVGAYREIIWDRPAAAWDKVTGLEDVRLYRDADDELWFNACIREANAGGLCQQIRGRLVFDDRDDNYMFTKQTQIMPSPSGSNEKNWMAFPQRAFPPSRHDFMYRLDVIYHADAGENELQTTKYPVQWDVSNISGSSQMIHFKDGLLAVVHEASNDPAGKRTYWHRFARFHKDGSLRGLSKPFVFFDRQIEFCAGLARHPNYNDLVLSFGVKDAEAWVATVSAEEVDWMCRHAS